MTKKTTESGLACEYQNWPEADCDKPATYTLRLNRVYHLCKEHYQSYQHLKDAPEIKE